MHLGLRGLTGFRKSEGGTPVPSMPPVVANQTLQATGALTLEGDGDISPVNTGGPIASIEVTAGDANSHWNADVVSGQIVFTPTAAGVTAGLDDTPQTFVCTITGVDDTELTGVEITMPAAEADVYSYASLAQLQSILALGVATLSGKTIKGRNVSVSNVWEELEDLAFTSLTTFASHQSRACQWNTAGVLKNPQNIRFHQLDIYLPTDTTDAISSGLVIRNTITGDVIFEDNEIHGVPFSSLDVDIEDLQSEHPHSRLITWDGTTTFADNATLQFIGNYGHDAQRILNLPPNDATGSFQYVEKNILKNWRVDGVVFTHTVGMRIAYNEITDPFRYSDDTDHADVCQLVNLSESGSIDSNIQIIGNTGIPARAAYTDYNEADHDFALQNYFLKTGTGSPDQTVYQEGTEVICNLGMGRSSQGIWSPVVGMLNGFVIGNAIPRYNATGTSPTIFIATHGAKSAGNRVADNVIDSITAPSDTYLINNVTDIEGNEANLFDGDFTPNTVAETKASLTQKSGGDLDTALPKIGPITHVDYDNYQIDHPRANRCNAIALTDLTDQTLNAIVTSDWVEITNADMYDDDRATDTSSAIGVLVWADEGVDAEIQIASETSGPTIVTDWTDLNPGAICAEGNFFRVRARTSPASETARTLEVYAGHDQSDEWSMTTGFGSGDFPVLEDTVATAKTVFDANFDIDMPSNIAPGDHLIVSSVSSNNLNVPTDWERVGSEQTVGAQKYNVFKKLAAGDEGASVTFTAAGSTLGTATATRISGAPGDVEVQFNTGGNDPPSLTPSWGDVNTLWCAGAGHTRSTRDYTAAPTNYSDFVAASTGESAISGHSSIGTAWRQVSATSEDPGTFTDDGGGSEDEVSWTIAVKPTDAQAISDSLLDDLSTTVDWALSLSRYLDDAFAGNAVVRLIEDNGSTEQDFKLVSDILVTDDVNEDTVAEWLTANSASNAHVATIYNQVTGPDFAIDGAENDALFVQAWQNGKPAILFGDNEIQRLLSSASITGDNTAGFSFHFVLDHDGNTRTGQGLFGDPNNSTFGVGLDNGRGEINADSGETLTSSTTLATDTPVILGFTGAAGSGAQAHTIRSDGAETDSGDLTRDWRSGTHVIGYNKSSGSSSTAQFGGHLAEFIGKKGVLTGADIDAIEADQAARFDIPVS